MVRVREETPEDAPAIRKVNELAFGRTQEAGIVDALRGTCDEFLSFVADCDEEVVGHILFTPATIETARGTVRGMGLAPMAVLPERQRHGIGSALVRHALAVIRERSCPFVIVLGHPEYYPRFGFEPASGRSIKSQWEGVPDEAFMILVMDQHAMDGVSGIARYRDEFDDAM
jgi:putative acetyltransferase